MNDTDLNWSDIAFSGKKPFSSSKSIFIAAPRSISQKRFIEIIKANLPFGPVVLGLAHEDYILGFEDQPQFSALKRQDILAVIDKVNALGGKHKIYKMTYFQRDLKYIIKKMNFKKVLFVNGSWKYVFHSTDVFYELIQKNTAYALISAFVDEEEARRYEANMEPKLLKLYESVKPQEHSTLLSAVEMLELTDSVSKMSYDYSFQTGAVLGSKSSEDQSLYKYHAGSFNKVVPFQTSAMLYGASRERNFSPPNDLNHYDTIHAEMNLLLEAQTNNIDMRGSTLFVNLMPCPTCARTLCEAPVSEIVYSVDHSDGYGAALLERAGKKIIRINSVAL